MNCKNLFIHHNYQIDCNCPGIVSRMVAQITVYVFAFAKRQDDPNLLTDHYRPLVQMSREKWYYQFRNAILS